jgi:hypothetical protein
MEMDSGSLFTLLKKSSKMQKKTQQEARSDKTQQINGCYPHPQYALCLV